MDVSVMQAKERLYELLGMLEDGEENQIVITRKGKPVAKIMDYYRDPEPAQRIRNS
ncbi:MAG: type II toxin-antitoxin system prevent-host-death family antitoxin [Synergistaceae bacterium]|nr:type II toxin-antitoxin system prevent-host-death family antitoxin [Synergistaceae bacterium]MBR0205089.1 type II toxin-antitoxin system prevent-host-death family antitoxin [Synergistaceae bacterium]